MKTKIPIKAYVDDPSLSWEARYQRLEAHHLEEIAFFVRRVEQFEVIADRARKLARGCDCEYDHRCGRCQAVINTLEAVEALDASDG